MRDYFGSIRKSFRLFWVTVSLEAKSVETNEYTAETTQDAIRTCFEALAEQFNIRELIIIHYYWVSIRFLARFTAYFSLRIAFILQ